MTLTNCTTRKYQVSTPDGCIVLPRGRVYGRVASFHPPLNNAHQMGRTDQQVSEKLFRCLGRSERFFNDWMAKLVRRLKKVRDIKVELLGFW
jgi:hypothetical protein